MDVTREQQILINLVRAAIVGKTDFDIPDNLDWKSMMELSINQGVAAISVDGLFSFIQEYPEKHLSIDDTENEDDKFEWLANTLIDEGTYQQHTEVIKEICDRLSGVGVKMMLLKGIGVGRYYPTPSHRPCGDIDIYLMGDYDKGNLLFESMGIPVSYGNRKHSELIYKDIPIENHKTFLGLDKARAERLSNELIEATLTEYTITDFGYYVPSPLTNYLFLLRHMVKHFCETGSITIRHLLDWGLFLHSEKDNLNIEEGDIVLQKMGLLQTKDIFVHLSQYVTGLNLSFALHERNNRIELSDVECRFLYEILNLKRDIRPDGLLKRSVHIVREWYRHKWKFEYLPDDFGENLWARILQTISFKFGELMKGHELIRRK